MSLSIIINIPLSSPLSAPLTVVISDDQSLPPVSDKLIAWLSGSNTSSVLKKDTINGYDFTIESAENYYPRDTDIIADSDIVYDVVSWYGTYSAPGSGDTGYTELLAIDDGTFYSGGIPIVLDLDDLLAILSDQFFFCLTRGVKIYYQVLTGSELDDAVLDCGDDIVVTLDSEDVTLDSSKVYLR